jgi:hypothetical protein
MNNSSNKYWHVLHLWAVFPGKEISREGILELLIDSSVDDLSRGYWNRMASGLEDQSPGEFLGRGSFIYINDDVAAALEGIAGSYPNLLDAYPMLQIEGDSGGRTVLGSCWCRGI